MPFKVRLAQILALTILIELVAAGANALDSFAEIRPRGYSDEEGPRFKRGNDNGPDELTVNYPEEARGFVQSIKTMMQKKHHQGSFTQTGAVWTLTDSTIKKIWIIKVRHDTPRKQSDLKGLQSAAALFPNNVSLLAHIWTSADKQKNWPVALEYYRKAYDPGPPPVAVESLVAPPQSKANVATVSTNCAYLELMMGHYQSAIKLLTKAIEIDPEYGVNYKNRAEAYRKLHKLDLAAQDEKKLQELQAQRKGRNSIKSGDNSSLALLLVALGLYEEAIKLADATFLKDPYSGLAHLVKARALLKMGKYKESLPDYKALLSITKDAAAVTAEVTVAEQLAKKGPPPYGDLSLLDQAKDSHQRKFYVIENGKKKGMTAAMIAADHKGDFRVYSSVCSALLEKSMWKPLDIELDKLLAICPEDATVVGRKIQASEAQLKWADAEKYCNHYLDLVAHDSVHDFKLSFLEYVYTVRAQARRAQKNYSGAIADETIAISIEPDSADAYRDRGDIYMQCGKFDLAVGDYTNSIKFGDAKDSDIYLRRAAAYEKLKSLIWQTKTEIQQAGCKRMGMPPWIKLRRIDRCL